MVIHPGDDDLKKLKKGQAFKQGDKIMREGRDGNATGNHFHIEVAACEFSKLKNSGWVKNSKGAWVISNNAIKPEAAFYVDPNFTKVKQTKGIKFKNLPKPAPTPTPEPTPTPAPSYKYNIGDKVVINGLLYASSDATSASGNVSNKTTTITRRNDGATHPYNTEGDLGWIDESSISLYVAPAPAQDVFVEGCKVEIIGTGNGQADGKGKTAYGIGYKRKIKKVLDKSKYPYPYKVGNALGTTGFYKASALKKI